MGQRWKNKRVAGLLTATRFLLAAEAGAPDGGASTSTRTSNTKGHTMRRDATYVVRRRFLTASAMTAVGTLVSTTRADAAEPTAEEKVNVQIVKDFCTAWARKDLAKIESLLADNVAVRWNRSEE